VPHPSPIKNGQPNGRLVGAGPFDPGFLGARDCQTKLLCSDLSSEADETMRNTGLTKVLEARKRVPGIEQEILASKRIDDAVQYADWVIRGRWEDAEPMIMEDPEAAVRYSDKVLRQRWKEAEHVIVQSPKAATQYASRVLRERWREAEQLISGSESAKYYARNVLAGRWDEKVAAMCPCWIWHYVDNECDGTVPEELHDRMLGAYLEDPNDQWVKKYFERIHKTR
jgi:hypothetical protein